MSKFAIGYRWDLHEAPGDTATVALWYPRNEDCAKFIHVELSDVRAADGIRVSYDFDRDGWKIEQASTFSWEADDEVCDPNWQEVAFIQSWGRQKPGPGDDDYTPNPEGNAK